MVKEASQNLFGSHTKTLNRTKLHSDMELYKSLDQFNNKIVCGHERRFDSKNFSKEEAPKIAGEYVPILSYVKGRSRNAAGGTFKV